MKRYLLFLALATLCSCDKNTHDDSQHPSGEGSSVRFATGVRSRGANITKDNISEFSVFCYDLKGTTWDPATSTPNKMNDLKVTRVGSSDEWSYGTPIDWEGGDGRRFTFLGYSPHATGISQEPDNPNGNNLELIKPVTGVPSLKYKTLDYVPSQIDLLYANPLVSITPQSKVYMMFNHALTQVRFKAWSAQDFVRVKSIEISNVKYEATVSILDGSMTVANDTKTFVLDNINRTLSTDEQNPTNLSDGANAFMLLPQDLTSNTAAYITVTYEVGSKTKTSTPYLIQENWTPNQSYTYKITLDGSPTEEMVITGVTMTDWIVDSEDDMSTTPPPPYIEVDGLRWAVGNLVANGSNGAKIGKPEDCGLYFYFGSLVGWSDSADSDGTGVPNNAQATLCLKPAAYTGSLTWPAPFFTSGTAGEDYRLPSIDDPATGIGDPCRFYLGGDWRTPTTEEWTSLLGGNLEQTNKNTPMIHAASNLTFPATGWYYAQIVVSTGAPNLSALSSELHLWSSSINGQSSFLNPYSVIIAPGPDYYNTIHRVPIESSYVAMPVRCVSGTYTPPPPPVTHNPQPPTPDQIVEINGLKWTTGNLVAKDALNCKVGAPTDFGLYFHFGSLIGWSGGATGDGTGNANTRPTLAQIVQSEGYSGSETWPAGHHTGDSNVPNTDDPTAGIGDPCRYYLGDPWRLPTSDEFKNSLCYGVANNTRWNTDVPPFATYSYDKFGVDYNVGKGTTVFFPNTGGRTESDGTLGGLPDYCGYWSSTQSGASNGYYLSVTSFSVTPQSNYSVRAYGNSVRCVSPPPPPAGSYIPTAVLEAAGWPSDKLPATGLQVAMRGDKQLPGSGTAATEDPKKQWKTGLSATVGVERVDGLDGAKFGMGKANTDAMIAAGASEHLAAQYCREMGPEWYLPNIKELKLIYDNKALLGTDYTFYEGSYYWNSTEYSSLTIAAWVVSFGNGSTYSTHKTNPGNVRCVREI